MIGNYKIIALCLAKVQDEPCRKIVKALNERLYPLGYRLFVYTTSNDLFWNTESDIGEKDLFELIDYSVIDGIIIYDEKIKNEETKNEIRSSAKANNVPVYMLDGAFEGCINLMFDYVGAFKEMIEHVISHGRKHLHMMAGIKDNSFSEDRINAMREVMQKHNLPFGDDDISYGDFWSYPAVQATKALLESGREFDAIVCANDAMAMAVSVTLKENGIRIPQDVIVTGFDGIDQIMFSEPQITSCTCDFEALAQKTVELITDPRPFEQKAGNYLVFPEILLAESCGCVNARHINIAQYVDLVNNKFERYQTEGRVLNQISARAQMCNSPIGLSKELRNIYCYDMCVLVKNEVLDESLNPMEVHTIDRYGEEFTVMLNTLASPEDEPHEFKRKDIMPNMTELLELHVPLIFTPLHFLHIPLGFACFFYKEYQEQNFNKIFQLTNELNSAIGGFRNIRFQKYQQGKIEDSYKLDKLTGYYNRMGFFREYDALMERLKEKGGSLTVALADLDNLKHINDHYGHAEGDRAICAVANAMKRACTGAIFCRFGGDEMLAVMETTISEEVIRYRLNSMLDEYNKLGKTPYPFSASLGVYTTTDIENMDFEKLLIKADELMYAEKKRKKYKRGE